MQINKNIAALLVIIFGLCILIGLVWFMFLAPPPAPDSGLDAPATPEQTGGAATLPSNTPTQTQPTVRRTSTQTQSSESEVRRLAANAVERYGTYSNQSGFANIRDLFVFMSDDFAQRSRQTISRAQEADSDVALYYGITTEAAITDTVTFNDTQGTGTFRVQAQRQEYLGGPNNVRSFQQTALVEVVKEGGVWKIDAIEWQE